MADDTTTGALGNIAQGIFGGTEKVKSLADTAQHYLDLAKAGAWAIDEETGTHLSKGFAYALEELSKIATRTHRLEQAPKIGNDTYAKKVSQHMLESVNSDEQSLLPVFNSLQDGLTKWQEAIDTAVKHYHAADEAATKHFGPFKD